MMKHDTRRTRLGLRYRLIQPRRQLHTSMVFHLDGQRTVRNQVRAALNALDGPGGSGLPAFCPEQLGDGKFSTVALTARRRPAHPCAFIRRRIHPTVFTVTAFPSAL